MSCAFEPKSNAHQTRTKSARLWKVALREKLKRKWCAFSFPLKAQQTRKFAKSLRPGRRRRWWRGTTSSWPTTSATCRKSHRTPLQNQRASFTTFSSTTTRAGFTTGTKGHIFVSDSTSKGLYDQESK
jgi:hypothetical protein